MKLTPYNRMDLLERQRSREMTLTVAKRNFTAAQASRLTQDWNASGLSINSVLSGQGPTLRARAKWLRENEYFRKFQQMAQSNIAGEKGFSFKSKVTEAPKLVDGELKVGAPDKLANTLIEWSFYEWGKKENCTVAKNMTWCGVQQTAVLEWVTVGETLWRMHTGAAADNRFGFALEHIAIDRLHQQSNHDLANGNRVRMGVETNRMGKVVAYWITDADPTDLLWNRGNAFSPQRYLAENFVHPFVREEAEQVRGYPWAAAAMFGMKMLAGYDEATLVGARAGACKNAFIIKNGTGVEYTGDNATGGGKYMDMEPGSLEELPQGMDVKVVDWNQPNAQYEPFVKARLRAMASALCVSYPNLANDYESVNFSSGRMARLEEVEFWKLCQNGFSEDFNEPIFKNWLHFSLLNRAIMFELASGRELVLPASKEEKFCCPTFHGRRWQWLDPQKELAALSEALRLKLTSWTQICNDLGIDFPELLQQIKEDKELADELGITLPDEAELAAAAQRMAEQQQLDENGQPIEGGPMTGEQFKSLVDGYGVAVRAGSITPNEDDEKFFRTKLGMPGNSKVGAAWREDEGVRRPITLVQKGAEGMPGQFGQPKATPTPEDNDGEARFHMNGNGKH